MLLASTSDLDDAIPSLVAYQLEWNKLHALLRAVELRGPTPADVAAACGGSEEDWSRVERVLARRPRGFVDEVRTRKLHLRIRMLGGSQSGYARITRRWWAPVRAKLTDQALSDKPMYFVSSNTHSLVNLVSTDAGASEDEIVDWVEANGPDYLLEELERFRTSRKTGSWENFLYYGARLYYEASPMTARRGTDAARRSASSASRTSPRAPGCACRRR